MWEQFKIYFTNQFSSLPTAIYIGLLLILFVVSVVIFAINGLKNGWRKVARLMLTEYLFLVFYMTVFMRSVMEEKRFNFFPFWSYSESVIEQDVSLSSQLIVQNILNVVLFVPVGIFLCMSFKNIKVRMILLFGVYISSIIEILQYCCNRGFSEIDDVIHNTLGCLIGYGIVQGVKSVIDK